MVQDDYARLVLKAGRDQGITPRGIVIGYATVFVESNWKNYANSKVPASLAIPHDAVGSDGFSVGLFQQQVVNSGNGWWWGDAATCMDPYKSAVLFFQRLKKLDYNGPNSPGSYAQAVQQSAFPDRYDQRMADAQALYDRISGGTPEEPVPDNRPAYNEFPIWTDNCQSRNGAKVTAAFIHTQQGGGGNAAAENLAKYCKSTEGSKNPVSYHYYVSQASDGGVTVVDGVDTDLASYSVGNANNFSINLCFAGSYAEWTRDQWMKQSNAIDVAAYLLVQDAKKYGFSPLVVPPPYVAGTPGISDHNWVTQVFKWGTHTDVGANFPWDIFSAAVAKYAGTPANPPAVKKFPDDWTDRELMVEILRQLRGPDLDGWSQLNGKSLIDAVAETMVERQAMMGNADSLAAVKAAADSGNKWAATVYAYCTEDAK